MIKRFLSFTSYLYRYLFPNSKEYFLKKYLNSFTINIDL